MKKQSTKKLIATAYHEAGHAVAYFFLRGGFHHVTIRPESEEDSLGHIAGHALPSFRPDLDNSTRARQVAERLIMCSFAGGAAEALHRGRNNWQGARSDWIAAIDLAGYFCAFGDEIEAYLKWLSIRTRNLVSSPLCWPGVEAVAEALLEREYLSSCQVRRIIRESRPRKNARKDMA